MPAPRPGRCDDFRSALLAGDNQAVLEGWLAAGFAEQVDLIYLDPPFSTGDRFGMAGAQTVADAYSDAWPSLAAYLDFLRRRLTLLHRLLAPHGALFLHCDWRTSAHLRLLLEEIFGAANFRNEIIWRRGDNRGRKSCARHLGRTADSILYFVRDAADPGLRFHPPLQLRRHRLRADGRPPVGFHRDADGRYFKTAPRGDYTDRSISRLRAENRVYTTRTGRLRIKYFLEVVDGCLIEPQPLDTIWTDLPDAMHLPSSERFGYPTQEPLALLERIVACASDPGDLVIDPFCGSGTTLVAAAGTGRRFLGCDRSPAAINLSAARLVHAGCTDFDRRGADPVGGAVAAAVCGLAFQRAAAGDLCVTPLPDGDAAPRATTRRNARGVRLRRDAAVTREPRAAIASAGARLDEPLLLLECRAGSLAAPASGEAPAAPVNTATPVEAAAAALGASNVQRLRLPLEPGGTVLHFPLESGVRLEYHAEVVDGLGRRFRVELLPGGAGPGGRA